MRCHVANQLEYLFDVLDLSAALLPRHYGMLLQRVAAVWSSRQQDAFDALKAALTSAPVLAFSDPTLPYTSSTDASDYAIRAVLQQDRGTQGKMARLGRLVLRNVFQSLRQHPEAFESRGKFLDA